MLNLVPLGTPYLFFAELVWAANYGASAHLITRCTDDARQPHATCYTLPAVVIRQHLNWMAHYAIAYMLDLHLAGCTFG